MWKNWSFSFSTFREIKSFNIATKLSHDMAPNECEKFGSFKD